MTRKLSKGQTQFIKDSYQRMGDKELAQALGVDKKSIRKELKRLNLKRTEEEERVIRKRKTEGEVRKEPASEPPPSLLRKKHLIAILLIVLAGFLVYANSFHNEFVWDDGGLIE